MRALSIAAAALCLLAAPALAHGPTPAALGVVPGTTREHGIVRLSSGLALRDDTGGWRYLCPAAWGGPGAPPTVLGTTGVWVLGDAHTRAWAGAWSGAADVSGRRALDLASVRGEAWALVERDGASALISLDTGQELPLGERWTTAAEHPEGFMLARAEGRSFLWLLINQRGEVIERRAQQLHATPVRVDLRTTGDTRHVVITTSAHDLLIELEALLRDGSPEPDTALIKAEATRISAQAPIEGPTSWGDTLVIVSGGAMYAWEEGALSSLWVRQRWTCLDAGSACTTSGVQALPDDRTQAPEQWFALRALTGPRASDMSPAQWPACQAQWLDFAFHAGIDPAPTPAPEPPSATTDHSDGCAHAPRQRLTPAALLPLLMCYLLMRLMGRAPRRGLSSAYPRSPRRRASSPARSSRRTGGPAPRRACPGWPPLGGCGRRGRRGRPCGRCGRST